MGKDWENENKKEVVYLIKENEEEIIMPKLHEYEIELVWTSKGGRPHYTHTEYGFGDNPPIIVVAKNKRLARKKLILPKTVKIRRITRVM